ncbi:MAG: hypothetical protein UW53_C0008G0036 [Candidatus Giovannonibacteria bacterium GW2011_GWA1_44_25]|uniref:Uncharacterized protein n=1 Tax=Candidatus Giovannonibacteria bacterium GW2011_GWA1_44_25 TaxID=1618645 RepID=A0A0G1ILH4_9BACT|nr:MAG: hypothetical protein UW53_C0008G0036 [Candidatus Giovannonibacteria bacterium GW2011_GWA1_44_25]
MVISSSGNVGIGTTSPAATLSVTGNTYLDSNLITYSSSTAANLTISYQRAATTTIPNLAINAWSIATSTSNTPVFTISSTSSPFGLIGIGTSSPSYTLSIAGNEYLTGGLGVGKATTTAGVIESSGLILSGGVFAALGTATSTFSGDINLPTGKCYQVNGTCTLMSAITSLNGLTGTTQTFASNDLISIVSPAAGTVHNFYGSTTPTFGWLHATSSTASFFTGALGIGTTSPWGLLSVNPDGISGPAFVVGSSTATNFIVTNGGNVGIGTAAPTAGLMLDIRGDMSVNNDGYYAFAEDKVNDESGYHTLRSRKHLFRFQFNYLFFLNRCESYRFLPKSGDDDDSNKYRLCLVYRDLHHRISSFYFQYERALRDYFHKWRICFE